MQNSSVWKSIAHGIFVTTIFTSVFIACGKKEPEKIVKPAPVADDKTRGQDGIGIPGGSNNDKQKNEDVNLGFEKLDDKKSDLSFDIMGEKIQIKIESVDVTNDGEKNIATTRMTINDEQVAIPTQHTIENTWAINEPDLALRKSPFTLHATAVCEKANCDKYLLGIIMLKNGEVGNTKAIRDFAILYEKSSNQIIVGLDKKSPEDLSTGEMFDALKNALKASKTKNPIQPKLKKD